MKHASLDMDEISTKLRAMPLFATLSSAVLQALARLLTQKQYTPEETIVTEGEVVDSVIWIVDGEVEVQKQVKKRRQCEFVPVAVLRTNDWIGLSSLGFYSTTGLRTATVKALTPVTTLQLSLNSLHAFLNQHQLMAELQITALQLLRMRLIKQCLPFSTLSPARLRALAEKVEEKVYAAGEIIFRQGDEGDKCYLIQSGRVNVMLQNDQQTDKEIAILTPPSMFGEATLITQGKRNATAIAVEKTTLLMIDYHSFSELIASNKDVALSIMNLMVDRSRPSRYLAVTQHQRIGSDGEEITILKNHTNGRYFKLSREGTYVWENLDGESTLRDITLKMADDLQVFAPDMVAGLIAKLASAGFVDQVTTTKPIFRRLSFAKISSSLRSLAEKRIAFGDADAWLTRVYQRYVQFLFTKPVLYLTAFIAMSGLFAFILNTEDVLFFFRNKHASLWLLLGLVPLSLMTVVLHELGHAFAVKYYGKEVHYMGVGWFWVAPIAFTDTSDMWLAAKAQRIIVNLAGVYVDVLIAGFAALAMFVTSNMYVQCMLWLFALFTYIGGLRKLSPLQEMDGYYILMDWLDKNRLRQHAVKWLVKDSIKACRQPRMFKRHKPEVIYWVACLIYVVMIMLLALVVQAFALHIFGIQPSNPYLTLVAPVLVAMLSSIGIISDIRKQED